jgi:hypothetical protein
MKRAVPTDDYQENTKKTNQVEALSTLLEEAGLDPADLLTALTAFAEAKELVYEDESAFIYRRGNTTNKVYYLRYYDKKTKKPSLQLNW